MTRDPCTVRTRRGQGNMSDYLSTDASQRKTFLYRPIVVHWLRWSEDDWSWCLAAVPAPLGPWLLLFPHLKTTSDLIHLRRRPTDKEFSSGQHNFQHYFLPWLKDVEKVG